MNEESQISQRGIEMPASPIRKLTPLAYAAEDKGVKIYRLNIGQPDLPTPQKALDVLKHVERRKCLIDGVNKIPDCYSPMPMGAFYTVAQLPVKDTEKFCAWCLSDFCWKDEKTPEGKIGETIMMAPAAGFYSTPDMGMNQVRLAYVLKKEDIQRVLFLLEKALNQFGNE